MATAPMGTLLRHLHQLAALGGDRQRTDRQLLDDFAAARDEAAFAALVSRHGPMVLRVCRRVLRQEQDAEDAFQATFLVLARHTASIRKREALASWLYGVAYRTAMKAKRSAARRRNHETRRPDSPAAAERGPAWDEVQAVLEDEIQRLPETYRSAFLLCVLEGKGGPAAAAELGVKEGTVWSRLTRARQLLRQRLVRRGIELSALLAAVSVADSAGRAAVPAALAGAAVRCGLSVAAGGTSAGPIPTRVAALAAGVTRAMFLTKAKIAGVALLAATLFAAGALTYQSLAAEGPPAAPPAAARPVETPPGAPQAARAGPPAQDAAGRRDRFVYRGRVLGPDGRPLAGARLYLVSPGDRKQAPPVRATTGADGRFTFTATRAEFLPPGAPADVDVFAFLQVLAAAKGYGPDWTAMDGHPPAGELTLRLMKEGGGIDGRILDLEGKPVAGARVRVVRLETTGENDLAPFLKAWKSQANEQLALTLLSKVLYDPAAAGLPRSVTAGADGRFHLAGAGREHVVVLGLDAPRIEHATIRIVPRTAAEVQGLVRAASANAMPMAGLPPPIIYGSSFDHLGLPARVIVGTVRDKATGAPVKGVRVAGNARVAAGAVDGPGETHVEAYTDSQGRYRLQGLPKAGKYDVYAWPGDFSIYIPGGKAVTASADLATVQADFEMMRGVEVRGRVIDKVSGKPVAAGVVYLPLPANRHPGAAFFRMVYKGCDGPRTGTFREMVPPGPGVFVVRVRAAADEHRYTVVRPDPAELARVGLNPFQLYGVNAYRVIDPAADAKSLTYDITVDPGRKRTATIIDPDGKPLTGAMVRELTAAWLPGGALKTARFTVAGLDAHEARQLLFVHVQRKLVAQRVVRGDEKGDMEVRLEPWATVTGRILDEDGRPVAGARVHLGFVHSTFFVPATWWVSPQGEVVKTDKEGRFRAAGLVAGMKARMSVSSDRQLYLPLAGTPDGQMNLSARPGEARDLGDLKVKTQ